MRQLQLHVTALASSAERSPKRFIYLKYFLFLYFLLWCVIVHLYFVPRLEQLGTIEPSFVSLG